MPLRVSALVLVAGTFILTAAAQQKAGNPWDVIGGYVCSQASGNSAPEELYLLPDMTWSQSPPFTSSAAVEHLSYSYRFRQPEDLIDSMPVHVVMKRRYGDYRTVIFSRQKPREFQYEADKLSLYTVEKLLSDGVLRRTSSYFPMSLFREFQVDPLTQELRQIVVDKDPQSLFVCYRSALF